MLRIALALLQRTSQRGRNRIGGRLRQQGGQCVGEGGAHVGSDVLIAFLQ